MEENKDLKIDPSQAAIISIISVMMIGEVQNVFGKNVNKIDLLKSHLKNSFILDDKSVRVFDREKNQFIRQKKLTKKAIFTPECAKVLRLMQSLYLDWKIRVFQNQNIYPDLKKIMVICEKIARSSAKDFTKFKDAIKKYLETKGCDFTEELSYTCSIVSLLHLATDYCELGKKDYPPYTEAYQSLTIIAPVQLQKVSKQMYPLLFAPDDIDVNDSPEVIKAIDELADTIYSEYSANFRSK